MASSDATSNNMPDDPAALRALVVTQAARIAILEEQLRLATAERFAPKSEKFASLDQLNLFNEAEAASPVTDAASEPSITVPAHTRSPLAKRRPIDAILNIGACCRKVAATEA